jgi:aspartyl-tRNA(Asn)/glutamyl-tRNA(Gln) amidotransferase subunit A
VSASPTALGAADLAAATRAGDLSVTEVVEAHLQAIATADGTLSAFHEVEAEAARARAAELDAARARGETPGPLFGVPVALKSNLCHEGRVTDCGSRALAGYRAPYTATAVERLLAAGAVPLGTTSMDEFGMGSSGERSAYEVTRNPWDPTRSAGGSSSGSAAAVAAGLVPLALGSDTGGSVRQPAAFCGVLGLKPTYGRVSRHGLVAFASSLDQVGVLAREAGDLELALAVISGEDPRDATSLPLPPFEPETPAEPRRLTGLRVGVPRGALDAPVEPAVRAACEARLARLEAMGAELREVELPHAGLAIPTYYVVATAEASSNLARYDGSLFGARSAGDGSLQGMFAATRAEFLGAEVKRRILLGTYVLSAGYKDAWYDQALRVRTLLRRDHEAAFEEVDLLAGPTSPTPAFALGQHEGDALAMYAADLCTVPASLCGLPAISVPAGFTHDARPLPVGLQLVGPPCAEGRLLRVAAALGAEPDAPETRAPRAGGAA